VCFDVPTLGCSDPPIVIVGCDKSSKWMVSVILTISRRGYVGDESLTFPISRKAQGSIAIIHSYDWKRGRSLQTYCQSRTSVSLLKSLKR
jgi:hypothetical protein